MRIESIQLGRARKVSIGGRRVLTAIHKSGAGGPVEVRPLGLVGDEQADLSVHGGLEKAVYAYPAEHYPFWAEQRRNAGVAGFDDQVLHGSVGENLTVSGLLEADVWVGDVLQFASCTLRVEQPREPCFKFNAAMGFNGAVKSMAQNGNCGFYLSVDRPGLLQAGEEFDLLPGARRVSIAERFQARMFKQMR
jgi:MOSC domain-containing protein YiiM